ncbi:hypothetical protein JCM11491_002361 [Sporobolomyces phaffii]
MATTPRPLAPSMPLASHRRPFSSLTDTPTPASSTSASHNSSLMQSLNSQNKQHAFPAHSRTHSRPLKPLSHPGARLGNISNSLDTLNAVEAIHPDDTELERKEHELSFERMMQELQDARISSSGASSDASSRGTRRFRDEQGSRSSDLTDDDDDEDDEDGSIRIGLSGIRYQHPAPRASAPEADLDAEDVAGHDSDDLTYITIPRSQLDPSSPARPKIAPATSNVFSSLSPRRPPVPSASTKENLPPLPPAAASASARKPPFLSTFSPPIRHSPAVAAAVAPLQPQYRSSPLNPAQNSPILAQHAKTNSLTSTIASQHSRSRSAASPSRAALESSPPPTKRAAAPGGKPVTIEEVSDKGTPPRRSTAAPSSSRWRSSSPPLPRASGGGGGGGAARSFRLPDMTFLTEALESPAKVQPRRDATREGNVGTASTNGSTATSQSKEAPLISGALSSLTTKLSRLERENEASASRVQHLEAQLAHLERAHASRASSDHVRRARQEDDEAERARDEARVRQEMLELLEGERDRRHELERLVEQLRLASAPARAPSPARVPARVQVSAPAPAPAAPRLVSAQACSTAIELKDEVKDLKFGLQSLGYEVEGVRGVVEGLLRDKEEKLEEKRWAIEEDERRRTLGRGRERGTDEGPETPRSAAGDSLAGSSSRSSFVSVSYLPPTLAPPAAEIERLQREQEVEIERRTPKKSAAPLHRPHKVRRALSVASSYDSAHDSTYTPSLESSVSSASTSLTAPSEASSVSAIDEPDFERAERIFKDVERAERRERRERLKEHDKERSDELCRRCLGKKRSEDKERAAAAAAAALRAKEKEKEKETERIKRERLQAEKERLEKEKAREKKKLQEREMHCRTLQAVLERLEADFASQKKIYLELSVEYQAMGARAPTKKRKALADHLKLSIDVLEEKAKDVKQYADALEDLYHANLSTAASRPSTSDHHHHHRH